MIYSSISRRSIRLGSLCVLALASVSAFADVKVVSKVTIETPRGPKVVTVVSFFKGPLSRIDTGDIRKISDSRTHKIVILNTAKRNYFVPDSAVFVKTAAADIKKQNMKITATVKATGKKKTIAGKGAQQFVGELNISGDYPTIPGAKAVAKFHIDEWTMQAGGVQVAQSEMMGTVGDILRSVSGVSGMQQVTKELGKIKGVPLNTSITGTMTLFASSGGAPRSQSLSFVTEATTVNESTLPASVFQIPAGFTKVDAKSGKAAVPKPKK